MLFSLTVLFISLTLLLLAISLFRSRLFASKKRSTLISSQGTEVTIHGEVHIYSQEDTKNIESLIKKHDILVHEGKPYSLPSMQKPLIAVVKEKIENIFYGILEKKFKLFAFLVNRNSKDFSEVAKEFDREVLGLETESKGVTLVGTLLQLICPIVYWPLMLYVLFIDNSVLFITFIASVAMFLNSLISLFEIGIKRDNQMACRINFLAKEFPNERMLVGLGKAHLIPVTQYLINKHGFRLNN